MTRPLALVVLTALLLAPHAALAKPKVALTAIDGDASGDVHDAVAEALEGKELSLISSKEVNRAVDKLGELADLTEKDFKKLSNDLDADAIVLGKLDKVGKSKTLKFRIYVHKKMAKGFTMSFKDASSEKFRTLLHDKVLDKITGDSEADADDAKPARKRAAEDDEDPLTTKKDPSGSPRDKARKPKKTRPADDDEEVKPRKAKAADDEEDTRPRKAKAGDDEEVTRPRKTRRDDGDDDAPRKPRKKVAASEDADDLEDGIAVTVEPPAHAANRAALRFDAGLSVLKRSFRFNATNVATNPKNTLLPPVPGVRLAAEAYPIAFSNPKSAAAGLGLGVDYDKTITLNITGTEYTILDPGLMFRLPVTRMFAVSLGGRGMVIVNAGPIQGAGSYGRALVYGADGIAALDVVLGSRLALRFSGELVQVGFSFKGGAALSNGLDGDAKTQDVGGLADRSYGGSATLAVLY